MSGMIKVVAIGNVGRDAEMKFLEDGTPLSSFSVAVNEPKFGNKEPETKWLRCTIFGKRAESLNQYLLKGTSVYIEGGLNVRKYTGNDGTVNVSTDVRVNEITLLGKKGDNAGGEPGSFASGGGFASGEKPAFGGGTAPKGPPATKPSTGFDKSAGHLVDDPADPF